MGKGAVTVSWDSPVLKILAVAATAVVGIALLSCSARETAAVHSPTSSPMAYEPLAAVTRAPLAPPAGYSSPAPLTNSATPLASYANPSSEAFESPTAALGAWNASPRWRAINGDGCIEVRQDQQAEFSVEGCSKADFGETADGR